MTVFFIVMGIVTVTILWSALCYMAISQAMEEGREQARREWRSKNR